MMSMVLGVLTGIYLKDFSASLAPIGKLYMSLLGMCITPLLIVSISSSIAGLIKNSTLSGQLKKIFILFPLTMASCVGLGLLLGIVGEPGLNLSAEAQDSIGKLMTSDSGAMISNVEGSGILSLLKLMIPPNIFTALTEGNNLAVLFFSIILGLSLGKTVHQAGGEAVSFLEVMYEAFTNMIEGIMYGLPIGLYCLFADHISHVGIGIAYAVLKYVVLCYIGCFVILGVATFILKKKMGMSLKELFHFIKEPAIVAIATSSSLASIPAILGSFDNKSSYSKDKTHLFVPLSICLNSIGASFSIGLTAIYMMDLYGIAISSGNLMILIFGSMFSAVAMSGAPGISALAMLGIVVTPLGIPLEPTILLKMAMLPLVESIITLANVLGNMAMVGVIASSEGVNVEEAVKKRVSELESSIVGESPASL